MDRDLDGRKAIVTGSGKGFGRAIALRLAGGGTDVCCSDVDGAAAEATAAHVRGLGRRALAFKADVSAAPDVEGLAAAAVQAFGRIDILVNNAGIWENVPIEEITEESWDRILGVIAFTKKLAMELGPSGTNVNTVNPGPTRTDLTAAWPAEYWENVIKRIPLGRFGKADDIAEAVAFLASERATFITGETLEVNGGLLVD